MALTDIQIANLALAEIGEKQISSLADLSYLQTLYDKTRNEILTLFPWGFARKRARLTAAGILDCSALTITFLEGVPDTITVVGAIGFVEAGFETEDLVTVEGSANNNTSYKVVSVTAGALVLETFEEVTGEVLVNDTDLKLYAQPPSKWAFKYPKPSDCLRVWSVNENTTETPNPKWDAEGDYVVTDEIDSNDQITIEYIKEITDPSKFSQFFIDIFVLKLASKLAIPIANDKNLKIGLLQEYQQTLLDYGARDASTGNAEDTWKDSSWQSEGH